MTDPKRSIWAELRGASLVSAGAVAVALFFVYALALHLSGRELSELGQFGDSFGALTSLFNALAFAALIATVVLQSRELRESFELTKQLEAARIRPFIKAEWHRAGGPPPTFAYQVKNVGLGVGVLRRLDLRARDADFGSVVAHGDEATTFAWTQCMEHAIGEGIAIFSVVPSQFDDLNRALAPGEWQAVVSVSFRMDVAEAGLARLRENFRPVIHFQSGDGKELSTLNQFESLKQTTGANP